MRENAYLEMGWEAVVGLVKGAENSHSQLVMRCVKSGRGDSYLKRLPD